MDILKMSEVLMKHVREFVQPAVDALITRMDDQAVVLREEIEERISRLPVVKNGVDGKDGISGRDGVDGKDGAAGTEGAAGVDGKDGDPGRDGVDGLAGKDGLDGIDGKDGAAGKDGVDGKDGADGRDGAPGVDGKSVAADDVLPALLAELHQAIAAMPRPKDGQDGKSISLADVEPLLERMVKQLQDGWALEFERRAQGVLERAVERIPKAQDGRDGADGKDGLGFDDMTVEHDGERLLTIKYARSDQRKHFDFVIPAMIYRGVFRQPAIYAPGDTVTWAGSLWHCDAHTSDKPGELGSKGWTLCAKKGRDGADLRDNKPAAMPQPIKVP
jgi:hypothetical protein